MENFRLETIIGKDGVRMVDVCFYLTHYAVSKTYKFFFLADKLRESGISCEIILCNSEKSGILPNEINKDLLDKFSAWNVKIKSKKKMMQYIQDKKYKFFVVGCYSGNISDILQIVKNNGAKTVEIATIGFNDPIEHNADINLLISELAFKAAIHKRPQRAKKAKNIHFVGSLFSDDIPNTYTSEIKNESDFRIKYKINKNIYVWMPGRDDIINFDLQKKICANFPKNADLVMTTHPWTEKYQQKELSSVKKIIKHIDSNDVYWAFKYMHAGIGRNSTSGIEICVFKKPMIYIGKYTRRPYLSKYVTPVGFIVNSVQEMNDLISENKITIEEHKFNDFISKIYPCPYMPAWQRILGFFKENVK